MPKSAVIPFLIAGVLIPASVGAVSSVTAIAAVSAPVTPVTTKPTVTPISWKRFRKPVETDDYRATKRLLQNSARYNLEWISKIYPRDDARRMLVVTGMNENGIRPPSSAVYGIAALLKTGGFDPTVVGCTEREARTRVAELIKGIAATHKVNSDPVSGWGDQWQSALWASLAGNAGWLLWDDLDPDCREMLRRVVEHEADRFVTPEYKVPYWIAPDGKVNFPGDTKAEENAWNACILQVAIAMMPDHPHQAAWKRVGNELMISAFALKKDMEGNQDLLDGKPIKEWLHGYNVREDGAVINHNRIHPDYMATPMINMRTYVVQPFAGQPVFEASRLNADVVYRCYVTEKWPTPPNKAPGGTIYMPGKAEIYYPTGTDWSIYRFDVYYLFDLFADRLKLDKGLPYPAHDWMRVRAEKMATMQARHKDGHLYADGEFDSYKGREQLAIWQFGDALLLQWLEGQQKTMANNKQEVVR